MPSSIYLCVTYTKYFVRHNYSMRVCGAVSRFACCIFVRVLNQIFMGMQTTEDKQVRWEERVTKRFQEQDSLSTRFWCNCSDKTITVKFSWMMTNDWDCLAPSETMGPRILEAALIYDTLNLCTQRYFTSGRTNTAGLFSAFWWISYTLTWNDYTYEQMNL